jgi:hypothetical protein
MLCYECDQEDRPAAAVCKVCGRGICRDHCVELTRCAYERVPSGMAAQLHLSGTRLAMMVCTECADALGDAEIDEKLILKPACCPRDRSADTGAPPKGRG